MLVEHFFSENFAYVLNEWSQVTFQFYFFHYNFQSLNLPSLFLIFWQWVGSCSWKYTPILVDDYGWSLYNMSWLYILKNIYFRIVKLIFKIAFCLLKAWRDIWDKLFKIGPSKICGIQPFTWSILGYFNLFLMQQTHLEEKCNVI